MSRGLPAAVNTALQSDFVQLVTFAELQFSAATQYVHDGLGTYTWGGHNWIGLGTLGSISAIAEGTEISPYSLTLTLSALDSTMSSSALTENYFMRPVKIYLGLLDSSDALIATPSQIWSGHMDVMTITAGSDNDSISLVAESDMSKFDRSANLKYTHRQQQRVDANDLFFEFLQDIEGAKVVWRGRGPDIIGVGDAGDLRPGNPRYVDPR